LVALRGRWWQLQTVMPARPAWPRCGSASAAAGHPRPRGSGLRL